VTVGLCYFSAVLIAQFLTFYRVIRLEPHITVPLYDIFVSCFGYFYLQRAIFIKFVFHSYLWHHAIAFLLIQSHLGIHNVVSIIRLVTMNRIKSGCICYWSVSVVVFGYPRFSIVLTLCLWSLDHCREHPLLFRLYFEVIDHYTPFM
jgi:hypothetical protein